MQPTDDVRVDRDSLVRTGSLPSCGRRWGHLVDQPIDRTVPRPGAIAGSGT